MSRGETRPRGDAAWQTAVSDAEPRGILIRGYPIQELIGRVGFAEAGFLLLRGRLPSGPERAMFEALLCAILDYPKSPAIETARVVASASGELMPAASAGLLCIGRRIASPQEAGEFLREAWARRDRDGSSFEALAAGMVADARSARRRIPGLGHPSSAADPRAERLRGLAREYRWEGDGIRFYDLIRAELYRQAGRDLPVNVDGMMAAILDAMGFAPLQMAAVAALSFLPGILAQAIEELERGATPRLIPDAAFRYVGPPLRHLDMP